MSVRKKEETVAVHFYGKKNTWDYGSRIKVGFQECFEGGGFEINIYRLLDFVRIDSKITRIFTTKKLYNFFFKNY